MWSRQHSSLNGSAYLAWRRSSALIAPIVEGHSEIEAVPTLIRRIMSETNTPWVEVGQPIRVHRNKVVKAGELERVVELARRNGARAVLIVLDADDDCPKDLAPQMLARAQTALGQDFPCSVVMPKREFESWFLGAIESLRGQRGISNDAVPPAQPEEVTDAKGWLTRTMSDRVYVEVDDQPALAQQFDFSLASSNCRSFRKFDKDMRAILSTLSGSATA